ncbi:unnamed protein product [Phytomonas sp. Hart1]|nr:unnamed protein product [Phytomonas sp. Hart1]|eukprot:CCW71392.1 unnamed protein product [Phytomonas sp. isolate Hart1]
MSKSASSTRTLNHASAFGTQHRQDIFGTNKKCMGASLRQRSRRYSKQAGKKKQKTSYLPRQKIASTHNTSTHPLAQESRRTHGCDHSSVFSTSPQRTENIN